MDESYDVIVLGTGLKECILSGLLSVSGKRVLHMDRNDYYGAESASFNLQQLKQHMEGMTEEDAKALVNSDDSVQRFGRSKEYNIDLCPKFIMANGDLVKMLLGTGVTRYLEFKCVDGSYVYHSNGTLYEVPVTPAAALASSLMGMFQKRRYKNFLQWVLEFDENDESTWKGQPLREQTMNDVFSYWKLSDTTQDFTGHAIALYTNDNYKADLTQTIPCLNRLKLYAESLARYEKSPYIYPMWGLGGLPEGFSRLAAVHGGVYMLRKPVDEILYNEDGTVKGVVSDGESAFCSQMVADPTYFLESDKIQETGFVARWICLLEGPVPGTGNNKESLQIIFPSNQTNHAADIYMSCVSKGLECAPQNRFVAVISSRVNSDAEEEARAALGAAYAKIADLVLQEWFEIRPTYRPVNHQAGDNIFIPSSMDATTHFQLATKEVMNIYHAITGEPVDLNARPEDINQ